MQVILKEDIPNVGKAGQMVKVSPGFGRNFLFPHKKAVLATPANQRQLEQEKKSIELKREKKKTEAETLAQKITAVTVTLEKQAGGEDKIFGSVSTREILDVLVAQGVPVDQKAKGLVIMKEPIKALGEHTVEIHLHSEVVVPLKINVVKK